MMVAAGLLGGAVLGLLAVLAWRGAARAAKDKTAWNSLKLVAAVALAGALVATVFAFRTPDRYVSTAVMRLIPAGQGDNDRQRALDRLVELQQKVLSRESLGEIITQPAFDLYREDRKRMPLEDVVENMRNKALRIQLMQTQGGSVPAFSISCEYPDNLKAQAVVRELVSRFSQQNVAIQRAQGPSAEENLEVLDPASLPATASSPNRPMIVSGGTVRRRGAGIVGGAGVARGPEQYATLAEDVMNHTGSLRWRIALLIAAAIAISYFDRQTLPVAIKSIQLEIPISNTQFSQLQAAFLTAYALMYAGGGKLVDVLGTRMGFLLIMAWWSVACASHGLATGFGMLAMSRFLLGMGEGGGFPAATKAVAEWFPVGERSTAMGIINAGTSAGAVVAPPLIAITLATLNWRWVFFLSGAAGLAWAIWWLWDYFPPPSPR